MTITGIVVKLPCPVQSQLEQLGSVYREEMLSRQQLEGENESLREQLNEAHETTSHLTSHVAELQDKYEDCSVLLKETQVCQNMLVSACTSNAMFVCIQQDEVQALKEASIQK